MGESQLQFEDPASVRTLLFVAAMAALGFVLGSIAVPVYPNVHFTFGEVAIFIAGATTGPLYGFIVGFVTIVYTGLVIWGEITVPFGYGFAGSVMAIASKKIKAGRLTFIIAALVATWVFRIPYNIVTEYYVSGYPWELIWAIQFKTFFQGLANAIIAYAVLKIPGIGKYIPVCYDSVPGRILLEKGNL